MHAFASVVARCPSGTATASGDKLPNVAAPCNPRLMSPRFQARVFYMKVALFAAPAAAGLLLAGCATIVSGSSQDVAVQTTPVSGATCVLSNLEGSWEVVTPAVAHVQRGLEALQVKCTMPGYDEAWTNMASHWNDWTLANVANFGVGFGVDSYTGAIDAYPRSVQLTMHSAATIPPSTPEAAPSASETIPPN